MHLTNRPPSWLEYGREIAERTELLKMMAKRDFLVRFKHTGVGFAWLLLRPLLLVGVLTFVFSGLARFTPAGGAPYALFVLSALIPWQFFAAGLSETTQTLVVNNHLVSKTYFPRIILLLTGLVTCSVDAIVAFFLLLVLFIIFGYQPGWQMIFLPVFVLLLLVLTFGLGLWLAVLNAHFRDIQHVLPLALQMGLYASPVGYGFGNVPEKWQFWYNLNPMVGVLEGFRWCLLNGSEALHPNALLASALVAIGLLVTGLAMFKAKERHFADIL